SRAGRTCLTRLTKDGWLVFGQRGANRSVSDEQWFSEMSVEYLAFCCCCFVFSALSSVFGFGAGLFALIVGSYVLPERDVVRMASLLAPEKLRAFLRHGVRFIGHTWRKRVVLADVREFSPRGHIG